MLQIERKKQGERSVYTLLNRYMEFINQKEEYPGKTTIQITNELDYSKNYFYSIKSEMRNRNLLEDYSEGPFRINISSNGAHTPILESEDLFQYEDSLELFKARFSLCLDGIEKSYQENDLLKAIWEASKSLFIFRYGQQYRFRFVLPYALQVFADLTKFNESTLRSMYPNLRNAIAQKAKYHSIPKYAGINTFYYGFLFYKNGSWFADLDKINNSANKESNRFLREYQKADKKQIANQDQVEEFLN